MGRQTSRNHIREQNRDPEIVESSNLTDAEFETLVIKFSENFNKNIKMEMKIVKGKQSEMENILSEMRSILNRINKGINKVNKDKDQISYLEDGKAKDTH